MKVCGCCEKEGPDEWFTTPSGDLCTRCRLAKKRVPAPPVVCYVQTAAGLVPYVPRKHRPMGKLDRRRKQRAEIADAIRRKLRYYVFYSAPDADVKAYFGCDVLALRERIRSRLPEGILWGDYGRTWGLSFRRALHTYQLERPAEFKKATSVRNATVVLMHKNGAVISGPL